MDNQLFIYFIVVLNVLVQCALLWRLQFPPGSKRRYLLAAAGLPLLVIAVVRILVAAGAMHVQTADQGLLERTITTLASILILAAPIAVTLAAVFSKKRRDWLRARFDSGSKET